VAIQVEASGETVGEAKWSALRELKRLRPGLDKAGVRFQVLSEGERGLLGVGYEPARVLAIVEETEVSAVEESDWAADVRQVLQRITDGLGVRCRIEIVEEDEALVASCYGPDLGLLIGRRGQTIDAVQYLVNAIAGRSAPDRPKPVVVDAAGYRSRRQATLESRAVRSAEEAITTRRPVELEPMTSVERKIVHLRLKDYAGVETRSEGSEPNRYVVVFPEGMRETPKEAPAEAPASSR
jgi:spoIIIJ-associated protein